LRIVLLSLALLFIALLAVPTALDFARHGVTVIGVLALLIEVLFMFGIVGALRQPPSE
jgi:hypothetical protein